MATPTPREDNVYIAKLAEQAERYGEMVEFMEKVSAAVCDSEDRRGAQPPLRRLQERHRSPPRLVADHVSDRAEGGVSQQCRPCRNDQGVSNQDRVRAFIDLRRYSEIA
ncbi:hypothetical protein CsSME_00048202 [Camellia sinensis var. sinensis]